MTPDKSFVNNFWDNDERGVMVVENKFKQSKVTFDELSHFYKERMQLEEEYGRKLGAMTRKYQMGSNEVNSVGNFFEALRLETEQMAKAHSTQAALISNEVYAPLDTFQSSFKARKRTIESTILKIIKYKKSIYSKMEISRAKYESECLKFRAMSADTLVVDGNELRKLNAKLEKSQDVIKIQRQEYYELYKEAVEIHERFVREWKAALIKYQDLEEERIKFLRSNIWTYCNLVSISCVNVDTSCENIRVALEKCEAASEIVKFVEKFGTGNEIPGLPEFIDYVNPKMSSIPSTESCSTVKISKKPPPQQISEQTSALLMLGKRSDETRHLFERQLELEEQEDEEEFEIDQPSERLIRTVNTRLEPPQSDYSEPTTSSQHHSHNSSSNYQPTSQYSEPTDLSIHNQVIQAGSHEGKKHWNSPQRRRRSRGALSDYSTSNYEPFHSTGSEKRKSFVLPKDNEEVAPIQGDDILRSTLRDLQLGGNGDMNALRKSVRPKSMVFETTKSQTQAPQRPRSMHLDTIMSSKVQEAPKRAAVPEGLPRIAPLTGRPVLKYCRAVYSYKAKEEDECSFKKKDIVLVLDDGDLWWSVEVLGKQEIGQAPSNYLAPIATL